MYHNKISTSRIFKRKKMPFRSLKGGMRENTNTSQVLGFAAIFMVILVALAALMWTNVIQFATSDAQVATATIITITGLLLLVYMMYLFTLPHDS